MRELLPVAAGFLLTTVLGGLLGFLLQRRSWTHQHNVQLAEQERERAVRIFEEVSRLLDRRLYRLRLLHWSLQGTGTDNASIELLDSRMDAYRQVLFDWNDSINRNLALIQQYFGTSMRSRLDSEIGLSLVELGRRVESHWKGRTSPSSAPDSSEIDRTSRRIDQLSANIYSYNLSMIRAIQSAQVGWLVSEHRSSQPAASDSRRERQE
jgi:hypothetical protein